MNFIYITTNLINKKQYVGSHKGSITDSYLGSGKLIKNAIDKYGQVNFKREILEICDTSSNLILEEKYIDMHNTLIPNGYNINKCGGHSIFDDALRDKLSFIKRGKAQSDETKEKRRKSMLGKNTGPKSDETRQKMSESMKGREPAIKGKQLTEESKEKMRKPHKKFSDETKEKLSKERKGRIKSEEHKKNISAAKMGANNPMFGKIPWNKGKTKESK